jgi:hypothetical protein
VVKVRKLTGCENVLDGQWKRKAKCARPLTNEVTWRNYFLREDQITLFHLHLPLGYMAVDNVAGYYLEEKIPCSDCTHNVNTADIQIVHVAS